MTGRVQTQPAWWDGKHRVEGGLNEMALKMPLTPRACSPALSLFPLPSGFFLVPGGPGGAFTSRQVIGWGKKEVKAFLPGTWASSPLWVQGRAFLMPPL